MSLEGQTSDNKSLRKVIGKTTDFPELAKDCVAFANSQGGRLLIGIEDKAVLPPAEQRIKPELLDTLRKRIAELTIKGVVLPSIVQAENGGDVMWLADGRPGRPWETRTAGYRAAKSILPRFKHLLRRSALRTGLRIR